MSPREVQFPAKDVALKEDVSALGSMVGAVLREQGGEALFALVEAIRLAAIERRESGSGDVGPLKARIDEADAATAIQVVRGFSAYFQAVNLAEKVHRIRRIRDRQREEEPVAGSLEDALRELKGSGISTETLRDLLKRLTIEPVMTAHPTEATRRTLLEKERSTVTRMVERLDPSRTPEEEATALQRIRQALTSAWQTRPYSVARPTVASEREHVMFYVTEVLYKVVPYFYESFRRALDRSYPDAFGGERLPAMLRFGSWVGGDMDGNPNVSATTILESLSEHRELIVGRYLPEVRRLAKELSQSVGLVPVNEAVLHRVARYERMLPEVRATIPDRYEDMPYRCLLTLVTARLVQVLKGGSNGYASSTEFLADLQLVRSSLEQNRGEHAGLFQVRRLMWRVRTFGFHLAALDVRQDAMDLRAAVSALAGDEDWMERPAEERTAQLSQWLAAPPELPDEPTGPLANTLAVFQAIAEARTTFGTGSIGCYIISMTQGADDVLSALLLARVAGLVDDQGQVPLDIAPLLETVDDLTAGETVIRGLAAEPGYRTHLAGRDGRQLVMIGYSDSNKDSGIAAARFALKNAQRDLSALAEELKLQVSFFHGRGGTVSRGGGNTRHGIMAAPAGSVNGYMRVTEQGEVIHQKYGIRPLAVRNLEQMTGATLAATLRRAAPDTDEWNERMALIAQRAREKYRALVYDDPDFEPYFRQATPIDVIERLAIGSRPSARRTKQGIGNLRAIPWVFSWGQTRVNLPGVLGFGTGVAAALDEFGLPVVRDMLRWPFFASLVNDVEMVLAKADLDIGRQYSELAAPGLRRIFDEISAEIDLATRLVLELKGYDQLLENDETLRRAIRLRNPYVDPLNLIQIRLLAAWRDSDRKDEGLRSALFDTVNGIARGIQNTG
ncbi:MAG: phosphoenolpyruvate carboxylase [Pseudomonadota bacterium]